MKAYGCGRGQIHRELQPLYVPTEKPCVASPNGVIVTDLETGKMMGYETAKDAAIALDCSTNTISNRLSRNNRFNSPFRGRYLFERPGLS